MHRSPVGFSVIFCLVSTFSITASAQEPGSHQPAGDKGINTFEVRAYSEPVPDLSQPVDNDPEKHNQGLVLDYYPFDDSGFRVSAGTFSAEQKTLMESYATGNAKTYLGVGWKKLLDDANRLDVSVEFGAFFGEEAVIEQSTGSGAIGQNERQGLDELEATVKTAKPVINFGIQYRF